MGELRVVTMMRSGAIVLAVLLGARVAQAGSVVGEVRVVEGTGDDDDMRLGVAAVGMRWWAGPTLEVEAALVGLATAGASSIGEPAAGGGGGEVGMRIVPWPTGVVRPHLRASVGLLGFPARPFLPGGDVYEGLITFGAGADVRVASRWRLGVEGFSVHLSNGQGLGPHNPAYDGYGAAVRVTYVQDEPPVARGVAEVPRGRYDGSAELELGTADGVVLAAARARPSVAIGDAAAVLLDVEAGTLAGYGFAEGGVALIGRAGRLRGAVQVGYRTYVGSDGPIVTAQVEAQLAPQATVIAMGHHERLDAFAAVWRAGVGLRAAPRPDLTVDLGVGFDRLGDHTVFGDDHSDPYLGAAWRTPLALGGRHLTLFVERQISTLDLIGVRLDAASPAWQRLR